MSARPLVLARFSQGSGTDAQTSTGVGVGVGSTQLSAPVTVPVPDAKPNAISRHSTMLTPVVDEPMDPVARQVAALPAAKGPS